MRWPAGFTCAAVNRMGLTGLLANCLEEPIKGRSWGIVLDRVSLADVMLEKCSIRGTNMTCNAGVVDP